MSFTDDFLKELKKKNISITEQGTVRGGNTYTQSYLDGLNDLEEERKKRQELMAAASSPMTGSLGDIAPVGKDIASTILGTDKRDANFWDATWRAAKRGYYNSIYGEESFDAMFGQENEKAKYEELLNSDEFAFEAGNKFEEAVIGAFELIGQQARQFTNPNTLAMAGSAAAAAGVAGQLGPQVALAEEVITMPAAAIAGFTAGSAGASLKIEAGLAYNEMLEAGISESTAKKIAVGVGAVNAGLDALQVDELVDAFKVVDKSGATKTVKQKILQELIDRGVDVAKETAQEVAQEGVTIAGTQVGSKYDNGEWAYSAEEVKDRLLDTAESSALSFGLMNVPATTKNTASIINESKNKLTANEQAVVDRETEKRIAEQETDDKKLTAKEKTAIKKRVEVELERGYISTDTIEEVLGGDDYKAYKDTIDSEEALKKEYETLLDLKEDDVTVRQRKRLTEIESLLPDIEKGTKRNDLKTKLSESVAERAKVDRLVESYNERARKGQAFEADVTKYDAKQQAVIRKAIDSGILNNTNRTHDFVDFVAKISAEKGVLFDFTNNAKLKESGFAVDGKTVNGYVTKDGIAVNIQAAKSLNSVVGHEITHVLEGTEFYDVLQKSIIDYAKAKGDYQGRYDTLAKLYEGVEGANVDAELTADLVGDYLFTDTDFISRLSTENRNVFQKIYDEVKHLLKLATAGSKEARELERVKHLFEKAYKDSATKNTTEDGGVKYSLESVDGTDYVRAEKNIFVKEDGTVATEREVFNSLVGKTIHLADGDVKIVKRLPDMAMYNELVRRWPKNLNEVDNAKQLNKSVNYNMEELLANSEMKDPDLPDTDGRHQKQGITGFDTRTVKFYDGDRAYDIEFSIAALQNGEKVAYAKRFFGYDAELTKKIQTAEGRSEESPFNQRSVFDNTVPQNGNDVKISLSDSEGRQLSKEQQDYFKDSKVRDDQGRLQVVYHGSKSSGFNEFRYSKDVQTGTDYGEAFYFTSDRQKANGYSYDVTKDERVAQYKKDRDALRERFLQTRSEEDRNAFLNYKLDGKNLHDMIDDEGYLTEGGEVKEVYLNLTNPLIVDAGGSYYYEVYPDYFEQARENGNDGIIVKNVIDNPRGEARPIDTYIAFKPEQIKNIDNAKPTSSPDIRFSLSEDSDVSRAINESMTMQEAKQMIQRAFVLGNIKEWYDGEYKNGDEWLKAQGAEDVAMIIENEYTLQAAYIDKIPGLLNEDFFMTDILDAYSAGTLTGKAKKKAERVNIADGVVVADKRFYAPQEIENAKSLYEVANQRLSQSNKEDVVKARAAILLYAHNKGAAETLGITDSELNKKLRSWGGYSAKARDISMRINAGANSSNRWTGIESVSWLNKSTVSNDEVARMVQSVEGDADGFQTKYIARTMLALDTHIDWSWLKIKFDTYAGVNRDSTSGKCNGYYSNKDRLVHVKNDAPNTVAHEMGHALDYQWGRDLGYPSTALTEISRNTEHISGEAKVWFDSFKEFADSLVASSDIRSEYSMDVKETFARFVSKFVEWTEQIGTGRSSGYESSYYNDKFTGAQFVQFARLLQEKSAIDANGKTENKFSLSDIGEEHPVYGNYNVYGKDIALEGAQDVAPVQTPVQNPVQDILPDDYAPAVEETADMQSERLDSLTEADMPAEVETEHLEMADAIPLTQKVVKDIAKSVKGMLGLSNNQVGEVYSIVLDYSGREFPSREALFNEVAERFGQYTEKGVDEDLKAIKAELRNARVYVDDAIKGDITDYGQFKKRNFGKIRFSNEGLPVDVVYMELAEKYPGYFPEDIINPSEQLQRMAEIASYDHNTEQVYELDDEMLLGVTDSIINAVNEFKAGKRAAFAQRTARESFNGLMRDADSYVPPMDGDIGPVAAPTAQTPVAPVVQEAPVANQPIKTVKERLAAKLQNYQTELANTKTLRDQSNADYDSEIERLQAEYDAKPNKNTVAANNILLRIERMRTMKGNVDADYAKRISDLEGRVAKVGEEVRTGESKAEQGAMRRELHQNIMDRIKTRFAEKGFDFDSVLKKAKNLSTFATVDNTPQRVMEKSLGYKEGQVLSDLTVDQVARNETEGIKWLNKYTDKKNGLLAQISKQYNIKPGSKESAAAQMYAEGFYVAENEDIIEYGDKELAKDFPDARVQANIKGLSKDPRVRQIYDETLALINASRARNAYPEIQKLDNYFLHFRAMSDTFSRLGLPFNPNDIKAKDLPTDLNGVTADLKPGQPYFASAMHRKGQRTSFDLLGGLEQYLTSAKGQIYHIDDIQTLRALRNYIADTFGQAKGLEGLDTLTEEEVQERIKEVYGAHLSTFAKFLNEEANTIAGKTALIDRGLEGIIGRRGITFLDTVNRQVGANMVGYNVSSSLTNFLAPVQAFAKTNKADFVKAFSQTVYNKLASINGKGDGFTEQSPVMIRRKGADRFHRTFWQKLSDPGYALMGAVDSFSTELIARAKYNEFTRKGMDAAQAHIEADKWTSRLMGDRSLGQQPQIYNSKMLGIITKFQLEVRNQLDSQFYDTIQETKVSNEDIENAQVRNAKTAAKVASTFFQLAVGQHLFGKVFESIAGYNPAFDIIEALAKAFGWDDDEEDEDTVLDNIGQGFMSLIEDMPYSSFLLDGGRVPMSSALPVQQFIKGEDQYGNEKSRLQTLGQAAQYLVLPGGYGQIKKTKAGLEMFSDEHPVAGSYTDSGNLRFPVEDTLLNRAQAAVFGQYASSNARDYFDNERQSLKKNQIQEFVDVDIPIRDYWEYRDGLKKQETLEDKFDYIAGLDLPISKKNILINNVVDRKEPVDLSDYDAYSGYEEFDFATKNPEKYAFFEEVGISYSAYKNGDDDTKDAYDWAYNNPDKYLLSKAAASDVVEYRRYAKDLYDIKADKDASGKTISGSRKEKVIQYLNNLDIDYGERLILFKSEYEADDTYNADIVEYLNGRDDISFEEEVTILKELGFIVLPDGTVQW